MFHGSTWCLLNTDITLLAFVVRGKIMIWRWAPRVLASSWLRRGVRPSCLQRGMVLSVRLTDSFHFSRSYVIPWSAPWTWFIWNQRIHVTLQLFQLECWYEKRGRLLLTKTLFSTLFFLLPFFLLSRTYALCYRVTFE